MKNICILNSWWLIKHLKHGIKLRCTLTFYINKPATQSKEGFSKLQFKKENLKQTKYRTMNMSMTIMVLKKASLQTSGTTPGICCSFFFSPKKRNLQVVYFSTASASNVYLVPQCIKSNIVRLFFWVFE